MTDDQAAPKVLIRERAECALSTYLGRRVDRPDLPEVLTEFLGEAMDLAAFMNADFHLILGRAYLFSTGARIIPIWPDDERPLADLGVAPQTTAARAIDSFVASGGANGVPQCFSAALAKLMACLVELADQCGANFEVCLLDAYKKRP